MRNLSLLIFVCASCLANNSIAGQLQPFFRGIEIYATIHEKSLQFTVRNNSDIDYMIADDFCFDTKLRTTMLDVPTLREREDSFSNGISRKQGRMMRLKSHSERVCEIGYLESPQKSERKVTNVLVVWHTDLFIGDFNDKYSTKEFSGVIPIDFPSLEPSEQGSQKAIDPTALNAYQMRKSLGVIN